MNPSDEIHLCFTLARNFELNHRDPEAD